MPVIKTFSIIIFMFYFMCSCDSAPENNVGDDITDEPAVQDVPKDISSDIDEIKDIASIQSAYSNIRSSLEQKSLDSTTVKFDCAGEQVGEIRYFTRDGQLRLVQQAYNDLSHRDVLKQYYIFNGQPFFILDKTSDWHFIETDGKQDVTSRVNEKRYYIIHNSLVQCLQKEYSVKDSDTIIPDAPNKDMQCPDIGQLLDNYKKLLSHQADTTALGCL